MSEKYEIGKKRQNMAKGDENSQMKNEKKTWQ